MKNTAQNGTRRGFKKDYEMAARTTVSMPQFLMDRAIDKAKTRGLFQFSAYVQDLIRRDLLEGQRAA